MKLDASTTLYDSAFNQIEHLTWLPWVGQDFSQRPEDKRLLVVGESHYIFASSPAQLETVTREHLEYPHHTRDVAAKYLLLRDERIRTFETLLKLLFKTNAINHSKFWSDTAFYNFVQRPMHQDKKGGPERPNVDDFASGWKVFAKIVQIIQPSHCLFIGVEAANSFNRCMALENCALTQKVSRTWARSAKMSVVGRDVDLAFVQHLGKFCSWRRWHDYLQIKHSDLMTWLATECYLKPQSDGDATFTP